MTLTVEMNIGMSLWSAFEEAYGLSLRVLCDIDFDFNQLTCTVYQDGSGVEYNRDPLKFLAYWKRDSGVWLRNNDQAWETQRVYYARIQRAETHIA